MDDRTLELTLARAAASLAYPPTPRLRGRVLAAIAAAEPASAPRRPAFALAMVAAAVALVAAMLALSFPGSRSAIADFFGVEGSKIERLPTPQPGVTPTPFPPPADLPPAARSASLPEIARALGFAPALPDGYSTPDEAFLVEYSGEAVSILRYAGFDLWQTRPRSSISFGKGLPQGVILLEITVGDKPAYFIEGGAHVVAVFDGESQRIPGSERTVERNTLIFTTDQALYRIETNLPRLDAVRIAEGLP